MYTKPALIVNEPSLRHRLCSGLTINLLASLSNQGSTILASIIVARFLGTQGFGKFAILQATLLTLSMISQVAIGSTVMKYVAEFRSVDPDRTGKFIGLCKMISVAAALLFSMLTVFFAPAIARWGLGDPELLVPLRITAITLLFTAINGCQVGILGGLEAFGKLARAGIVSGIMTLLSVSVGTWRLGLDGAFWGLAFASTLRCVVHYRCVQAELQAQGIHARFTDLAEERRIMFNFVVPATVGGYYSSLMVWLANAILVRQPSGYGEMALYGAAMNLRACALFLPIGVVNSVCLSLLNNVRGSGNKRRYQRLFKTNVAIMLTSGVIVAAFLALFGSSLMSLFGRDFKSGTTIFRVALLTVLPETLCVGLYQNIQAQGRMWLSAFFINFPRDLLIVISACWLIPSQGALGLVKGYCLASTVAAVSVAALNAFVGFRGDAAPTIRVHV